MDHRRQYKIVILYWQRRCVHLLSFEGNS